jgi:hypothetical protein
MVEDDIEHTPSREIGPGLQLSEQPARDPRPDGELSAVRLPDARKHARQLAFAGAVRPDHRDALAEVNLVGEAVDKTVDLDGPEIKRAPGRRTVMTASLTGGGGGPPALKRRQRVSAASAFLAQSLA